MGCESSAQATETVGPSTLNNASNVIASYYVQSQARDVAKKEVSNF